MYILSELFLLKLTLIIAIIGKRKRTNPVRRKRCDRNNIALKHEYNFNRSIDTTMVCAENQYNNAGSCPGDSGKLQCFS